MSIWLVMICCRDDDREVARNTAAEAAHGYEDH